MINKTIAASINRSIPITSGIATRAKPNIIPKAKTEPIAVNIKKAYEPGSSIFCDLFSF